MNELESVKLALTAIVVMDVVIIISGFMTSAFRIRFLLRFLFFIVGMFASSLFLSVHFYIIGYLIGTVYYLRKGVRSV